MPEDSFDILEVVISPNKLLRQPPGPHQVLRQEVAPAQTPPGLQDGGGEEGISLGERGPHTKHGEREEEEENVWRNHRCVAQLKYSERMTESGGE